MNCSKLIQSELPSVAARHGHNTTYKHDLIGYQMAIKHLKFHRPLGELSHSK